METRTYWLSFCDNGFMGACVVDVTTDDAQAAETDLVLGPFATMYDPEGGPWITAAARIAADRGCNPGGQVMAMRMDDTMTALDIARYPKDVLISKAQLAAIEGAEPKTLGELEAERTP